ncbi:hypothetical protein JW823_01595 [bacterium]|nr:hypothetical protein [candidate division CSSED10-310 bacterium]
MKIRNGIVVGLVILVSMSLVYSASKKPSDLMQIPEFQAASSEAKLAWLNGKLESKEFTSGDISMDVMTRLILDVLVQENNPLDMMKKYGEIREKYGKLGATYDLEKHLAVQYLATDPEAIKADIPGKCKIIHRLNKQKVLSWPGIADLLQGMMALHLATSADYQAMTPLQKIEYLRSMDGLNIVSNQTSSSFSKGIAAEWMSKTPASEQAALYKEIEVSADFFTKSAVKSGYMD